MKLNDRKTLRDLSIEDLQKKLQDLKKEYAVSAVRHTVGKLKNVKSLSTNRDTQALVLTVIAEKQKATN